MGGPGVKVLLDTHVLLWMVGDPRRLSPRASDVLGDPSTTPLVSAASGWELATKHRLGKLPEAGHLLAHYAEQMVRRGAEELPVSTRHALVGGGMSWEHQDPFDRLLAAQAVIESVPLVTKDPVFDGVPGVRVLW